MACRKEGGSFLLKNTIKSDPKEKKNREKGKLEGEAPPSL